jgi:hypothetical protein
LNIGLILRVDDVPKKEVIVIPGRLAHYFSKN